MKRFILAAALLIATLSPLIELTAQQAHTVTSADGIPVVYEVRGEGEPALVFVHGWSCDRSYWNGQLEAFAQRHKVITIDLAGHGQSGSGLRAWTMESFGRDVEAVIKKLNIRRAILIGHSMGGDVIAEAALRLPERIAGLVMVDTYKNLDSPLGKQQVEAIMVPFRKNFVEQTRKVVRKMFIPASDTSLVNRVVMDMSSAPLDVALGALESAISYGSKMPGTLNQLKLPVVAINPDNAPTSMESMKRHGIEVVIMPGVGHFLMMEDPDRFNTLLSTAIEKF